MQLNSKLLLQQIKFGHNLEHLKSRTNKNKNRIEHTQTLVKHIPIMQNINTCIAKVEFDKNIDNIHFFFSNEILIN